MFCTALLLVTVVNSNYENYNPIFRNKVKMLAIPVKKSRGASIKSIVVIHLKKTGDYSSAFDEVLVKYDALRTQAIANDATLAAVKSYLAQLLYFEENFPVTGPDAAADLRLSYNWRSAFQSSGQFSDGRFIVEKAATLFNLAARHTFEGQKLDDPAAMKLCCEHWSNAAGIFKFIRTELGPTLGATGGSDLKPYVSHYMQGVREVKAFV